jgi:ribose/xylose/arabinose/galactoside ABC-type transport system permease subunit
VIFMLVLMLVLAYALRSHRLGPACLCRGRRPGAAELSGVNVDAR